MKLLSAAVMPQAGIYELFPLTAYDFKAVLSMADKDEGIESYIGYQATVDAVKELTGLTVELSRGQAVFQNKEYYLIIRLKSRVQDPTTKGTFTPSLDDYELFACHYQEVDYNA